MSGRSFVDPYTATDFFGHGRRTIERKEEPMIQKANTTLQSSAPSAVGAEGGPGLAGPTGAPTAEGAGAPPVQRWRAKRKAEVVVRIVRGTPLDAISREIGVPVARLELWRDEGLAGLEQALQVREEEDPVQARLDEANRRIGELSMENELLRVRCRQQEATFRMRRLKQ